MAPQSPPASTLIFDSRTQIIDNCEFTLTRDDIVTVVTSKDPDEKFYRSYAVRCSESSREAILVSDPCETAQQATESLHTKSCEAIHNYITANGFANPQDVNATFDAIGEFDDATSVVSGHSESSTAAFSEWGHSDDDFGVADDFVRCRHKDGRKRRPDVTAAVGASNGCEKCRAPGEEDDDVEKTTARFMGDSLDEAEFEEPPPRATVPGANQYSQPLSGPLAQNQSRRPAGTTSSLAFRGPPPPPPGWVGPPAPPPSMRGMPLQKSPLQYHALHQQTQNGSAPGMQPKNVWLDSPVPGWPQQGFVPRPVSNSDIAGKSPLPSAVAGTTRTSSSGSGSGSTGAGAGNTSRSSKNTPTRVLSMPAIAASAVKYPRPPSRLYAVRLAIHWLRHGQRRIVTCCPARQCDILMVAMSDVQANPGSYVRNTNINIAAPDPAAKLSVSSAAAPIAPAANTLRSFLFRALIKGEAIDMRSVPSDDITGLFATVNADDIPLFEVLVDSSDSGDCIQQVMSYTSRTAADSNTTAA